LVIALQLDIDRSGRVHRDVADQFAENDRGRILIDVSALVNAQRADELRPPVHRFDCLVSLEPPENALPTHPMFRFPGFAQAKL
jgi:hypothetical protein